MIAGFAQQSGRKMFNAAFKSMCTQLRLNFDKLPRTLEGISKFAVQAVKDHIDVLLNNIIEPDTKVEGELEEKLKLQQDVSGATLQWDLEWKVSKDGCNPAENIENIELPKEYVHGEDFGEEDESIEADEDESYLEGRGSGNEDDSDDDMEDGSYTDGH